MLPFLPDILKTVRSLANKDGRLEGGKVGKLVRYLLKQKLLVSTASTVPSARPTT
jgi:hypothetical protein